jgi:hypothetical protein
MTSTSLAIGWVQLLALLAAEVGLVALGVALVWRWCPFRRLAPDILPGGYCRRSRHHGLRAFRLRPPPRRVGDQCLGRVG